MYTKYTYIMKHYDLINYLTEDLISNHLKDDYCLAYFPDNIRFDSSIEPMPLEFTKDKHVMAGNYKTQRPDNQCWHIFHNNKWLWAKGLPYILRKHTKYNIYQHSWEPIDTKLDKFFWDFVLEPKDLNGSWHKDLKDAPRYYKNYDTYEPTGGGINKEYTPVILHSEKQSNDIRLLRTQNVKSVYWFAHAYLCSEFYFKHYQKLKMVTDYKARPIQYKWFSANRLLRKHRTDLLELLDLSQGCYSLANPDPNGLTYDGPVPSHSFDDHGNDSAEICVDRLTPWNTSFLHIVNETVWQDKIHFTEKIFKPIVLHQPFVVLQAPGSLEYLKSYGFKTFDKWWDENYDTIQDPTERLNAIAKIINDIGRMSVKQLEALRMEMADVLEYNFCHFYENIPAITLGELENNIKLLST